MQGSAVGREANLFRWWEPIDCKEGNLIGIIACFERAARDERDYRMMMPC